LITVTGVTVPSGAKICVIPSFLPIIPFTMVVTPSALSFQSPSIHSALSIQHTALIYDPAQRP
jgi:hypothetical protein